jgi:nucleoside-diphosphate-sugar epimerase
MGANEITVGVTGARGYFGTYLCAHLRAQGFRVVEFDIPPVDGESARELELGKDIPADRLQGVDVLVHTAYDFTALEWHEIHRINVEGSRKLFQAAKQAGVKRILLISTMAAFEGCKSMYGKAKLLIENEALSCGGVAVRPGLMWGGGPGGLVDSLGGIVTKSRFVPMFGGGKQVLFLNHRQDLSGFVARFAAGEIDADGVFTVSCDKPWTFGDILRKLAEAHGRQVTFVPVPWKPIYWLMKAMEKAGKRPPFRSDSLLSLMNQDPSPDFSTCHRLGLDFRDFDPG